jgi:hypothetical protein
MKTENHINMVGEKHIILHTLLLYVCGGIGGFRRAKGPVEKQNKSECGAWGRGGESYFIACIECSNRLSFMPIVVLERDGSMGTTINWTIDVADS